MDDESEPIERRRLRPITKVVVRPCSPVVAAAAVIEEEEQEEDVQTLERIGRVMCSEIFVGRDTGTDRSAEDSSSSSAAITQIVVLEAGEEPGDGVERCAGGELGAGVFLGVSRDPERGDPIVGVQIAGFGDVKPGTKVVRDLANAQCEEDQMFLFVQTQTDVDAEVDEPGHEIELGNRVDVRRLDGSWCSGKVAQLMGGRGFIRFEGAGEGWSEWIDLASPRLARLGTHTSGICARIRLPNSAASQALRALCSIDAELVSLLRRLSDEPLTEEQKEFLYTDNAQQVLEVLALQGDYHGSVQECLRFLRHNIDWTLYSIKKDEEVDDRLFQLLYHVFQTDKNHHRFFSVHGISLRADEGHYAVAPPTAPYSGYGMQKTSAHLIDIINYFGEAGGFDVILNALEQRDRPLSICCILWIIKAIHAVSKNLRPEFALNFIPRLQRAIHHSIAAVTDGDIKVNSKDRLTELAECMEKFVNSSISVAVIDTDKASDSNEDIDDHHFQAARFCEMFRLEIASRLIACPFLAKRLLGLSLVLEMMDNVEHADKSYSSGYYSRQSVQFMTKARFVAWLERTKLLGTLLVQASHQELLKRTSRLLQFLALNGGLTRTHLEALWSCSIGKHEVVVRAVYGLISDLSQDLDQSHLDIIFSQIESIPLSEYCDYVIEFVQVFTANAIQSTAGRDGHWYGLEVFWRLIQDESPVSREVSSQAYNALCTQLDRSECKSQLTVYIDKCMDNLAKGESVPQSLRMAKDLIHTLSSGMRTSPFLVALDDRLGVIDMILKDLQRYKESSRKVLSKFGHEQAQNIDDLILVGCSPHGAQLGDRLDFLYFMLKCPTLHLFRDRILQLWDCFVSEPISSTDISKLLKWLANLQHSRQMNSEDSHFLFMELLANPQKLDPHIVTENGFDCFELYFRAVNSANRALVQAFSEHYITVHAFFDLEGVDSLWEIAVYSRDEFVFRQASDFLISLHLRLDADDQRVWAMFTSRSVELLGKLTYNREVMSPADETSAHRILTMLSTFLARHREDHHHTRLAKQSLLALRKNLIDDESSFKLLLSLLSKGSVLGDASWKLLQSLPFNDAACSDIRSCVDDSGPDVPPVDWARMFVPKSPLRLLYALEIVDQFLSHPSSSPRSYSGSGNVAQSMRLSFAQYCHRFLVRGGLAHLCSILLELDVHEMFVDELHRRCLSLLLSVIVFFVERCRREPSPVGATRSPSASGSTSSSEDDAPNGFVVVTAPSSPGAECTDGLSADAVHDCLDHARLVPRLLEVMLLEVAWSRKSGAVGSESPIGHKLNLSSNSVASVNDQSPRYGGLTTFDDNHGSSDVQIISCSMTLLMNSLEKVPALFDSFASSKFLRPICIEGLLEQPNSLVRRQISRGIATLSTSVELFTGLERTPRSTLLPILVECIPEVIQRQAVDSRDFFHLLMRLLQQAPQQSSPGDDDEAHPNDAINTEQLFFSAVRMLERRPIFETRQSAEDFVLRGLLRFLAALVDIDPSLRNLVTHLVRTILHDCLFEFPTAGTHDTAPPPKSKSSESRIAAFALVEQLCSDGEGCEENLSQCIAVLYRLHLQRHSGAENNWSFRANLEEKSETGYVGLHNPCNVCYINALLQSIFMIPPLRQRLLEIDIDSDEEPEDNFLYQLQRLFGYLQESERPDGDPTAFCMSFKDWDGSPIDMRVQKDTNEFLNLLFDRIDTKVKGTKYEKVLQDQLGGYFSNELICKGCPHYSEREEPFYCITLSIQNKKSIIESLEAFVEGEMLEGDNAYMCGKCNKKVDTLKRVVLKRLPPTVIFHLKRFELNYDTMEMVKLNDRCEFPLRINLKPYTKAGLSAKERSKATHTPMHSASGLPDDIGKTASSEQTEQQDDDEVFPDSYYEYELCGILVHTGSAFGGHYYSFVKERGSPAETRNSGRWFEYNDSIVRPFDEADIPCEAFGGQEHYGDSGHGSGGSGSYSFDKGSNRGIGRRTNRRGFRAERRRNAYMLFYDRVHTDPADVSSTSLSPSTRPKSRSRRRSSTSKVQLPPRIFNSVWRENETYWRDFYVHDTAYFELVWKLMSSHPPVLNNQLINPARDDLTSRVFMLSCHFVLVTLVRASEKTDIRNWFAFLSSIVTANLPCCVWLVKTLAGPRNDWFYELLLNCPLRSVRALSATLFSCALCRVANAEDDASTEFPVSIPCVERLIGPLLTFVPTHSSQMPDFLSVLLAFASSGESHAICLINRSTIARLVDMLMGSESAAPAGLGADMPRDVNGHRISCGTDYYRRSDDREEVDFTAFFQLLSVLVRNCHFSPNTDVPIHSELMRMPQLDEMVLARRDVCERLLHHCTTRRQAQSVGEILAQMSRNSLQKSGAIISFVFDAIENNDETLTGIYFVVLETILRVHDSLSSERLEEAMSALLKTLKGISEYWSPMQAFLLHFANLADRHIEAAEWLHARAEDWAWAINWLRQHQQLHGSRSNFSSRRAPGGPRSHRPAQDKLLEALEAIAEGRPVPNLGAEQDCSSASDLDKTWQQYEIVDAQDSIGKWCDAVILDVLGTQVQVHYIAWDSKWDEWMDASSTRLRPHGEMTRDPTQTCHKPRPNLEQEMDQYRQLFRQKQAQSAAEELAVVRVSRSSSAASTPPPPPLFSPPHGV